MATPPRQKAGGEQRDIAGIVAAGAAAAAAQATDANARRLNGPERAAILMLALGEQFGASVWTMLDDDELRTLSILMSQVGTIQASQVGGLLLEFVG